MATFKKQSKDDIRKRLRSAKTLLTAEARRVFGKGRMNIGLNRYVSDDGTWALQWYPPTSYTGSYGQVRIVDL